MTQGWKRCMGGKFCTHQPGECTADPAYQAMIPKPSDADLRAARRQRYLGDQEAARKELALYPEHVRQRLEAWQEQQGEWFSDTVLEIVAEFIKHDDARRIAAEREAVPVAECDCGAEPFKSASPCRNKHLPDCPAHPPKEPKQRPWCETCGKDVPEVLCPTCAKWWHDNPPELEARDTKADSDGDDGA
jgi:hypothetical protein